MTKCLCTLLVGMCAVALTAVGAQAQTTPTGACCLAGGGCVRTTEAICTRHGGTYQGDNTSCSPTTCPRPATGACCLSGGFCAVLTHTFCTALGGTYQGDDTTCTPTPCTPPPPPPGCPCDWDHDGHLTASDFFAFIHDFFAGNADFNGDGVTNTRDFFDFIACLFNPPPGC